MVTSTLRGTRQNVNTSAQPSGRALLCGGLAWTRGRGCGEVGSLPTPPRFISQPLCPQCQVLQEFQVTRLANRAAGPGTRGSGLLGQECGSQTDPPPPWKTTSPGGAPAPLVCEGPGNGWEGRLNGKTSRGCKSLLSLPALEGHLLPGSCPCAGRSRHRGPGGLPDAPDTCCADTCCVKESRGGHSRQCGHCPGPQVTHLAKGRRRAPRALAGDSPGARRDLSPRPGCGAGSGS